jgi:hypothetical protein
MATALTEADIKRLESLFGVKGRAMGNNVRFELAARDGSGTAVRKLALEIYLSLTIGRRKGSLVSVYTDAAHIQLHFCTGVIISEELEEATFIGEHEGRLSGLIVEKAAGCSLFANVDRSILSGDFTRLAPEVMMSGVALSLAEPVLQAPAGTGRKSRTTGRKKRAGARG